jgi:hypothetical protein
MRGEVVEKQDKNYEHHKCHTNPLRWIGRTAPKRMVSESKAHRNAIR